MGTFISMADIEIQYRSLRHSSSYKVLKISTFAIKIQKKTAFFAAAIDSCFGTRCCKSGAWFALKAERYQDEILQLW